MALERQSIERKDFPVGRRGYDPDAVDAHLKTLADEDYNGNGVLDDLPVDQCRTFEAELLRFVENAHPGILTTIREKKTLDDDLKNQMNAALKECKARFVQDHPPQAAHAHK